MTDAKKNHQYVVVEFPDESTNGNTPMNIISSSWIFASGGNLFCYWPPFKSQDTMTQKVKEHSVIKKETCQQCPIIVKYTSGSYQKAAEKLESFLEDVSSQSETEIKMPEKRCTKRSSILDQYSCSFLGDSEDDDDVYIPKAPKPKKKAEPVPAQSSLAQPSLSQPSLSQPSLSQPSLSQPSLTQPSLSQPSLSRPLSSSSQSGLSSSCGCEKNEALIRILTKKIENMAHDIRDLLLLAKQNNSTTTDILESPILNPSTSKEELRKLNDSLDPAKITCMSTALQTIGGKDTVDTTRRILTRLLTTKLALEYNWSGQHNKGKFSDLKNIIKLIIVSVRCNAVSRNATQEEVEAIIKVWLRNAPDRDGGRSRRKNNIRVNNDE